MPPNDYLAVSMHYLRPAPGHLADGRDIGKTMVSSSMIDRVAAKLGAPLFEVPVGFKWFVDGLVDGEPVFRRRGKRRRRRSCAATARSGRPTRTADRGPSGRRDHGGAPARIPAEYYKSLTEDLGETFYARSRQSRRTPSRRRRCRPRVGDAVTQTTLAGSRSGRS